LDTVSTAAHLDLHSSPEVAAIIFAILAIIWGIVLLIGSIPAVVKAVRVTVTE
jgi:hypothetical protein